MPLISVKIYASALDQAKNLLQQKSLGEEASEKWPLGEKQRFASPYSEDLRIPGRTIAQYPLLSQREDDFDHLLKLEAVPPFSIACSQPLVLIFEGSVIWTDEETRFVRDAFLRKGAKRVTCIPT